jgi:hypothetical protein
MRPAHLSSGHVIAEMVGKWASIRARASVELMSGFIEIVGALVPEVTNF